MSPVVPVRPGAAVAGADEAAAPDGPELPAQLHLDEDVEVQAAALVHAAHDGTVGDLPWRVGTPRCGAYVPSGAGGAPAQCQAEVTHAGLRLGAEPVEVWRAFSCRRHASELRAPRELLDRDREVLADWHAREQSALNRQPWDPPGPIAVGAAAREIVRRAEAAG